MTGLPACPLGLRCPPPPALPAWSPQTIWKLYCLPTPPPPALSLIPPWPQSAPSLIPRNSPSPPSPPDSPSSPPVPHYPASPLKTSPTSPPKSSPHPCMHPSPPTAAKFSRRLVQGGPRLPRSLRLCNAARRHPPCRYRLRCLRKNRRFGNKTCYRLSAPPPP